MIINFSEIGSSLGTRELGAKIREEILCSISKSEKVTFDFLNVEVVSSSFADECFGKLLFSIELEKLKTVTHFTNANPFIEKIISNALKGRLVEILA